MPTSSIQHTAEVDWLYVSEDFYQSAGEELQAAMREASAYALAYVDADRNKAYEDAYATLQERSLRTARFVTDNLRKSGKKLLTSETDFFTQIDKSRYDAVTMIIRIKTEIQYKSHSHRPEAVAFIFPMRGAGEGREGKKRLRQEARSLLSYERS